MRVTAGSAAISCWTVTWTFANGQSVNQAWNATVIGNESDVTAANTGYNGSLGAGASATFGFIGSWSGPLFPLSRARRGSDIGCRAWRARGSVLR